MSLYQHLGVDRSADAAEIKKAYRKMSLIHHPDKGGDINKFKEIQHAYEILSDEQRRSIYDQTGSETDPQMQQGGPGGPMPFPFDMSNLFGGMFGGGGMPGMPGQGQGQKRRGQKAPSKLHEIPIGLWDFYHGKDIKLQFERQKFCEGCKGEGTTSYETCAPCGGSGTRQTVMMIGPGMQGIMRGPCPDCTGKGKRATGTCAACRGSKFKTHERSLQTRITPGMRPGTVIVFPGECSDNPDFVEAGDVQIRLQEADEDIRFSRRDGGDDLKATMRLWLRDSLLGYTESIKGHPGYPDGLAVTVPAGTQNGETIVVPDRGMPRKDGGHGALHILVHVVASPEEKALLGTKAAEIRALFTCEVQSSQDQPPASTQGSSP
jgi:DnaJ family protein A protein 2